MERESFESEIVAEFLNQNFVSIKLDREERPEIDAIYMSALQAISGGGGWPMSVFLTPDLKPFFAGTYYPPKPAFGRPSFLQLLMRISELWATEREKLEESGDAIVNAIESDENEEVPEQLSEAILTQCFTYFKRVYDAEEGGFGNAPKFPRPVQFDFLFRFWNQTKESQAREMALYSLEKMAAGGMHDHLGGGFHRYSVDRYWRVSHFEKMLYDQAQLVNSYLDAYQISQRDEFGTVVRDTCDYVLRDLSHADGAFFSAEDADSEGQEGTFYVWTYDELSELLGENALPFLKYYGITREGNFEHGKNVLYVAKPLSDVAKEFGKSEDELRSDLGEAKRKLLETRTSRIRPHLDDKILTSWNGLMIGALARAGAVLDEPRYTERARQAATFILTRLVDSTGGLLHRWRDGEARFPAVLDSYAFFIKGLLDLYETTSELVWLEQARRIQSEQDDRVLDERGGYFMSRPSEDVIVRSKGDYDGAEPSGNSISAMNLLRLAEITEEESYQERAGELIASFAKRLKEHPYSMPELLCGIVWQMSGALKIVLSGEGPVVQDMRRSIFDTYLGNFSLVYNSGDSPAPGDFARSLVHNPKGALAFVCHGFTCETPIQTAADLKRAIGS